VGLLSQPSFAPSLSRPLFACAGTSRRRPVCRKKSPPHSSTPNLPSTVSYPCPHRDKSRSVIACRSRARPAAASTILLRAASGDATLRKASIFCSREDEETGARSNASNTALLAVFLAHRDKHGARTPREWGAGRVRVRGRTEAKMVRGA